MVTPDSEAEKEEKASYAFICEFFTTAKKKHRHEMIKMLKERVQQFCYHRDGSCVGKYCILYGNEKQLEIIVKSFKDTVVKAVKDVFAQNVILSIFDYVDHVELINNYITKEIGENIGEIIFDNYGQCVLQHIIDRLNYPHSTTDERLKKDDENKHFERYRQIFDALKKPLLSFIAANMEELLFSNITSTLVLNVLEPESENEIFKNDIDVEYKAECFQAIANLVGKEFIPGTYNNNNIS
uniref:CPL domain-containing protein n=1 Tax=Panagrolaimus sp. PS1159 TaxID=55785 RepID=A0AC35F0P3_9BILA